MSRLKHHYGGLAVQSATQLAPSAYLASAVGSADLVRQIVPPRLQNAPCPDVSTNLNSWSQGHNDLPPIAVTSCHKKARDSPRATAAAVALLEIAPDQTTRARLLATRRRELGAWLQPSPPHVGTDLVSAWMMTLHLGLHGLSCRKSQGRHSRHAAINELIRRALASVGVPSHLEPLGISCVDGKRPDGATVMPWRCGQALVWDATCPDTYPPLHLALAARKAGAVANKAEQRRQKSMPPQCQPPLHALCCRDLQGVWT